MLECLNIVEINKFMFTVKIYVIVVYFLDKFTFYLCAYIVDQTGFKQSMDVVALQ